MIRTSASTVFGLSLALVLALALPAQAFVSFGDTHHMHPDGGANARTDHAVSLANDGAGNWVAATDGPYVSLSSDNGDTWTTPVLVPGGDGIASLTLYTDPMVVTDKNGVWILTEMWFDSGSGNDKILVWRSTDNGASWTGPVDLVAAAGTTYENRPRIATDGAGKWIAVWAAQDPVNGDSDIAFSTSADNGMTWSPATWINADQPIEAAEEYYPAVASDGAGNWVIVTAWFGSPLGSSWHVRSYRSTNFGASWSLPLQYSTHIGLAWPDVVSGGPGVFLSIHTRQSAIIGRSSDGGATWSAITLGGYPSSNARPAHIDTDGNGEWVAIWDSADNTTGTTGADFDVVYSKSTDNGLTWSQPNLVDLPDAIADPEEDSMPAVASDGADRWIAAWQRTSGPSLDTFVSISDPLCPDSRRNDCIAGESGKSQFSFSDLSGTDKDKMKFKLGKGGLTDIADFGTPTGSDSLLLCVWDSDSSVDELIWRETLPGGVLCDGEPCWKQNATGFNFKDKATENSPFTKAKLKAGEAGKAQVSVQLGGAGLAPPQTPLTGDTSVAVQLISDQSGKCWGADFSAPKTNDSGKYSAKSN